VLLTVCVCVCEYVQLCMCMRVHACSHKPMVTLKPIATSAIENKIQNYPQELHCLVM